MGNRRNHAPRRQRQFCNSNRKLQNNKTCPAILENDTVTTDCRTTVVVDVVPILSPVSDVQHSYDYSLDHNPATTGTNIQDEQDPLFVFKSDVKTESIPNKQPNEVFSIWSSNGTVITKLEIEPFSNEDVMNEPLSSTEFKNMCRLCLSRDECTWIEIFANEPYDDVEEITPSNIAEIIEQSTTVKISANDNLPNQLCSQCFQSLRFVYQFREKSIRSQKSLNSMVNAISRSLYERNEQKKVNVAIGSQPTKRLVKVAHLKRARKPIRNSKPSPTINRTAEGIDNLKTERQNDGDVQCELCGKVFEKSESLLYHLNRHNGVKPFACTEPFCDKSFDSPMNRKNHILNVHCLNRRYKCDLCEKAYNKAEKLRIHRTTHFPPTIPCTICGKLLRSQASIYKHRASHAERLFKCDDCGKSFQNAYTLKVHRRIHTNEKPFICCKCGEPFAHKCLLKAHTERKHSD